MQDDLRNSVTPLAREPLTYRGGHRSPNASITRACDSRKQDALTAIAARLASYLRLRQAQLCRLRTTAKTTGGKILTLALSSHSSPHPSPRLDPKDAPFSDAARCPPR